MPGPTPGVGEGTPGVGQETAVPHGEVVSGESQGPSQGIGENTDRTTESVVREVQSALGTPHVDTAPEDVVDRAPETVPNAGTESPPPQIDAQEQRVADNVSAVDN